MFKWGQYIGSGWTPFGGGHHSTNYTHVILFSYDPDGKVANSAPFLKIIISN